MNTMDLWMTYAIGPTITVILSYFTYLFGRKKTIAETKTTELDNTEKAISIWRQLAEDITGQLKVRDELIAGMKLQMDMILSQNSELLKQNQKLISKVNLLEKDLNKFRIQKN